MFIYFLPLLVFKTFFVYVLSPFSNLIYCVLDCSVLVFSHSKLVKSTAHGLMDFPVSQENGDDPGRQKSGSMFGRKRKSAFKAKHAGVAWVS